MSYETGKQMMGYVNPEIVATVTMPRADFLAAFDEVVAEGYETWDQSAGKYALKPFSDEIVADLRHVAESMPHFPLHSWLTTRGCGCVVGEYLIAHDILKREQGPVNVVGLLARDNHTQRDELIKFGEAIDRLVADRLEDQRVYLCLGGLTVVFEDES